MAPASMGTVRPGLGPAPEAERASLAAAITEPVTAPSEDSDDDYKRLHIVTSKRS